MASLAASMRGQREQSPPVTDAPKAATVEFVADTDAPRLSVRPRSQSADTPNLRAMSFRRANGGSLFPLSYREYVCCGNSRLAANLA